VSPVNKEAKEDLDKFIQELILQNSSGKKWSKFEISKFHGHLYLAFYRVIKRYCFAACIEFYQNNFLSMISITYYSKLE